MRRLFRVTIKLFYPHRQKVQSLQGWHSFQKVTWRLSGSITWLLLKNFCIILHVFFSLGGIQVSSICNRRCKGFNFQAPEAQPLPSPAPEGCASPSLDHSKLYQDSHQQEEWCCCPIQNIVLGGWLVGWTRGALYCDYCNAYKRKSRSWNLVAIGMHILGLAGVLNSNCSIKLFDF